MDNTTEVAKFTRGIACVAFFLAFIVVILGAYTRLTDAGLGCPDWPGCYGHLFPDNVIDPSKAWSEMIHRYAAGTLGILIFVLGITAIIRRQKNNLHPVVAPVILMLLVIFQAALGMWTVTLKLFPPVVMGHLLGGMAILALLWLTKMQLGSYCPLDNQLAAKKYKPWALLGLIIVACQIALGGWTSSNYAALACTHFPFCQGQLFPIHQFRDAFNLMMPIGANFEGGVLDSAARVTIQVMHRLGALITFIYLVGLSLTILFSSSEKILKKMCWFILLFLVLQIILGILNVVWLLPLTIAVMHNAGAALLLLSVVSLTYAVS